MWLEYLILVRISIDISQLDEMLMGGIESGTVTIISGPKEWAGPPLKEDCS